MYCTAINFQACFKLSLFENKLCQALSSLGLVHPFFWYQSALAWRLEIVAVVSSLRDICEAERETYVKLFVELLKQFPGFHTSNQDP